MAFAADLPRRRICRTARSLPDEYGDRRGIKTGYGQMGQVGARARSRAFPLRLFLLYPSAVFANMWVRANCIIPGGRKNGPATKTGMVLEDFAGAVPPYGPERGRGRAYGDCTKDGRGTAGNPPKDAAPTRGSVPRFCMIKPATLPRPFGPARPRFGSH